MIEILTTPKIAVIFAIALTVLVDILLTAFLTFNGLTLVGSFIWSSVFSIVLVLGIMIAAGIVFHAHKKITS